jgi:hypothetical protein
LSQDRQPRGTVLAALDPDYGDYCIVRTSRGYIIHFYSLCEFRLALDLSRVTAHLLPAGDPGLVPILLSGNVLATLLLLLDRCVIHASAVADDEVALAFVGASGMGKSSLAAMFCSAGFRLVTDDTLRIDFEDGVFCYRGTGSLRLRESAQTLASHFPAAELRRTADGRVAIDLPATVASRLRLHGCVLPELRQDATAVEVVELSASAAVRALLRYPRILGWTDPRPLRLYFDGITQLARSVPVYRAAIPREYPLSAELSAEVLERVRAAVA